MKRFFLSLSTLVLTAQFFGCGGDAPPPPDRSNMPPEVKAEEDRLDAEAAKRAAALEQKAARKH